MDFRDISAATSYTRILRYTFSVTNDVVLVVVHHHHHRHHSARISYTWKTETHTYYINLIKYDMYVFFPFLFAHLYFSTFSFFHVCVCCVCWVRKRKREHTCRRMLQQTDSMWSMYTCMDMMMVSYHRNIHGRTVYNEIFLWKCL